MGRAVEDHPAGKADPDTLNEWGVWDVTAVSPEGNIVRMVWECTPNQVRAGLRRAGYSGIFVRRQLQLPGLASVPG